MTNVAKIAPDKKKVTGSTNVITLDLNPKNTKVNEAFGVSPERLTELGKILDIEMNKESNNGEEAFSTTVVLDACNKQCKTTNEAAYMIYMIGYNISRKKLMNDPAEVLKLMLAYSK